jgi:hypothetical protein
MLKRLSILDMHLAIKNLIEEYSDLKLLDAIKPNEKSPFAYFEITNTRPDNTKTMFVDKFTVHIHIISKAEKNGSSVQHYKNIQSIEEVFTKRMRLDEPFDIFRQSNDGMLANYTEKTGEKHAVLAFSFWVSYGFKVKI